MDEMMIVAKRRKKETQRWRMREKIKIENEREGGKKEERGEKEESRTGIE